MDKGVRYMARMAYQNAENWIPDMESKNLLEHGVTSRKKIMAAARRARNHPRPVSHNGIGYRHFRPGSSFEYQACPDTTTMHAAPCTPPLLKQPISTYNQDVAYSGTPPAASSAIVNTPWSFMLVFGMAGTMVVTRLEWTPKAKVVWGKPALAPLFFADSDIHRVFMIYDCVA